MPGKFLIINWPSTKEVTTCKHEIINGLVSNFFNSTACLVFAHCYLPSVYVCPDLLNVAYKLGNIPGGGGYSREFWIGVCREGSWTLTLFKD